MNGVNMKLDQLFNSALSGAQFGQGLPPPSHLMAMPPTMMPLPPHMPPVMAAPFGILPPHAALGHLGHSPMHMMHPGLMQPPTSMMNSNSSLPPPPGMHSPMTVPSPQNYGFSSPVALPSADSLRSLENSQHLQLIQSIIQSTKNSHLGSGGGTSPGGLTFPHTASPQQSQQQQQQQRNGRPSLSSPNPLMNAFPSLFGNSSVQFQVPLSTPSQRQQQQQGTNQQTTQQQQFSNNQHQASPGNGFLESLLSGNFQRQEQSDHSSSSSNSQDIAQSILASLYQNSPENEVPTNNNSNNNMTQNYNQVDNSFSYQERFNGTVSYIEDDINISKLQIPQDVLDDLASRFVLNMPGEEKDDPIRICFQIEIAFWFYTDFYCETMSNLPKLKLKKFAYIMFTYIPRLRKFLDVFEQVITTWIDYKFSIPTSGAVLLDSSLEKVLLVQGYGSRNWSFPKGKVNHEEPMMNCAIREVLEETGYDCTDKIYENIFLERKIFESACRLFLVTDVETDFSFHPHVRNEIRSIQWFEVDKLPMRPSKKNGSNGQPNGQQPSTANAAKFFTVFPFVYSIRKWIEREKKRRRKLTRRERKRTNTGSSSNGDCVTGSGSGSGEEHGLSNSNSPYTIVEHPPSTGSWEMGNESTSFVDVNLDDILNGSHNQSTISYGGHEQSLAGYSVFQATDSDAESSAGNGNGAFGSHGTGGGQSSWPTTWQTLVNTYNRQNSIHTPIGYDLMAAPKLNGEERGTPLNGIIKLEDLEAPTKAPPSQREESSHLHELLGSKKLTCDDKLNFLFNAAASKQHQESQLQQQQPAQPSPSVFDNGNSVASQVAALAFENGIISPVTTNGSGQAIYSVSSKPSPYGAIGSKHSSGSLGHLGMLGSSTPIQQTTKSSPDSTPNGPNGHFDLFNFASSAYSNHSSINNNRRQSSASTVSVASSSAYQQQPTSAASAILSMLNSNSSNGEQLPTATSATLPLTKNTNAGCIISESDSEASQQQQQPQQSDVVKCAFVTKATQVSAVESLLNPAHYNGLDPKIVPTVQEKIRLLADRLKFLQAN